jgi:hypothetical protein
MGFLSSAMYSQIHSYVYALCSSLLQDPSSLSVSGESSQTVWYSDIPLCLSQAPRLVREYRNGNGQAIKKTNRPSDRIFKH